MTNVLNNAVCCNIFANVLAFTLLLINRVNLCVQVSIWWQAEVVSFTSLKSKCQTKKAGTAKKQIKQPDTQERYEC